MKRLFTTSLLTTALFLSPIVCDSNKIIQELPAICINISRQEHKITILRQTIIHEYLSDKCPNDRSAVERMVNSVSDEHLAAMELSRLINNIPASYYYRLVYKESGFKQGALSNKNAVGYMQVTRIAWEECADDAGVQNSHLEQTPIDNIIVGTYYIRYLKDKCKRWDKTFMAYNAGISGARKYGKNSCVDRYSNDITRRFNDINN